MDKNKMFGKRLKQLRKDKAWSQESFAFRANLNRSYVGQVERGEKNLSLRNIFIVAETLDIDPQELFDFSDLEEN